MKKEKLQSAHTEKELKAIEDFDNEDIKVVSSMKGRAKETELNEKIVQNVRKSLNYKDETDPAKRRALRKGK